MFEDSIIYRQQLNASSNPIWWRIFFFKIFFCVKKCFNCKRIIILILKKMKTGFDFENFLLFKTFRTSFVIHYFYMYLVMIFWDEIGCRKNFTYIGSLKCLKNDICRKNGLKVLESSSLVLLFWMMLLLECVNIEYWRSEN